ncbi:MAG: cytochrome c biogenesis protein CcsA [Acidimicrobiia bacterium]
MSTRGRSDALSWLLLGATVSSLALLTVLALVVSPPDAVQGDAARLLYLHVPAAWSAYLAFGVTTIASVLYLAPKTRRSAWDRIAGASAELGVVFTGLTLFLGAVWGRPVWGIWWTWDARITTTTVLFFLYLGYLALRRIPGDANVRAKRVAIVALIAALDIPIVHFSVTWWRTLHQEGTVFNPQLDAQIHGVMAFTLWFGVLAFTLLYCTLLRARVDLLRLEQEVNDRALDRAIATRQGEPGVETPPSIAEEVGA